MRKLLLASMLFSTITFFSCQKSMTTADLEDVSGIASFPSSNECGTPVPKDLLDMGGLAKRGDLQISNNDNEIIIWASASGTSGQPNQVKKIIAVYGSYDHVATVMNEQGLWTPCQGPLHPDRVKTSLAGLQSDSIHLPKSSLQADGCLWVAVYVTLTDGSGFEWCTYPSPYDGVLANQSIWKVLLKYCYQDCGRTECGGLRTQTQGGWGSKPAGNNNGTYLHANFAAAFPTGLKVGCASGYTVSYTSAQAITEFLPAGGTPAALSANATNPADKSIKNVLIGQVTALSLNVGFDLYDNGFGEGDQHLGDMFISKGVFAGKTVTEFLTIANAVLGGCSTAYKASEINDAASAINESYDDGNVHGDFLTCTF